MNPNGRWSTLYRTGAIVAVIGVVALLFDIVLSMMPGWGTDTVPTTTLEWFRQFDSNAWLGLRNLDLLNVTVSVVTLPMYLAIAVALRRTQAGLVAIGVALLAVATALFAASNAALPMLQLARDFPLASPAEKTALAAGAAALLSRGAHGSVGAFPAFFLSEIGTVVVAAAMLMDRMVFGRVVGILGVIGASALAVYSVIVTFTAWPENLVVALAAPGGLLMIAWQAMAAKRLWAMGTDTAGVPTRNLVSADLEIGESHA